VPGSVDVLLLPSKIHRSKERPVQRPALGIKNGSHRAVCSLRHHEDESKDSDVHCSGLAPRRRRACCEELCPTHDIEDSRLPCTLLSSHTSLALGNGNSYLSEEQPLLSGGERVRSVSKKTHTTTVVLSLPLTRWPPIQAIGQEYDRLNLRWIVSGQQATLLTVISSRVAQ
jgi:hypothetical protein